VTAAFVGTWRVARLPVGILSCTAMLLTSVCYEDSYNYTGKFKAIY